MRVTSIWTSAAALAGLLLVGGSIASAHNAQSSQPQQQQQQQQQPSDNKQQAPPISMDQASSPGAAQPGATQPAAAPPPSPEEEAAYKAFQDAPATDVNKKLQLTEDFLKKYPQSRYRPAAYQSLVSGYFATQQVPKLLDAGEKEIALNPNDAPVLAVVAQTIARTFDAKAPNAEQELEKAETYSKRAIDIVPTLPKPTNLTDEAFTIAKNDTLEMAHGGLGLVYIRRAKYAEAIPELEASIKDNTHPQPDPVNYYLLGMADSRTSHYDAAVAAYSKCAAIQSSLAPTCKAGADEAKKAGATQLSAPN
jgi:tetratricopeptide (TPR) repeat protein